MSDNEIDYFTYIDKKWNVLRVNSLFAVTRVFNYFALSSALSSSHVRATSKRIYLSKWESGSGLSVC